MKMSIHCRKMTVWVDIFIVYLKQRTFHWKFQIVIFEILLNGFFYNTNVVAPNRNITQTIFFGGIDFQHIFFSPSDNSVFILFAVLAFLFPFL